VGYVYMQRDHCSNLEMKVMCSFETSGLFRTPRLYNPDDCTLPWDIWLETTRLNTNQKGASNRITILRKINISNMAVQVYTD
jgi:hypothetical protein